jgi:hypothetical protein
MVKNKLSSYNIRIFFTNGFIKQIKKSSFLKGIKVRVYATDSYDALERAKMRFFLYDEFDERDNINDLNPYIVEIFFYDHFISFLKKGNIEKGYKREIKSSDEDKATNSVIARIIKYSTTQKDF